MIFDPNLLYYENGYTNIITFMLYVYVISLRVSGWFHIVFKLVMWTTTSYNYQIKIIVNNPEF